MQNSREAPWPPNPQRLPTIVNVVMTHGYLDYCPEHVSRCFVISPPPSPPSSPSQITNRFTMFFFLVNNRFTMLIMHCYYLATFEASIQETLASQSYKNTEWHGRVQLKQIINVQNCFSWDMFWQLVAPIFWLIFLVAFSSTGKRSCSLPTSFRSSHGLFVIIAHHRSRGVDLSASYMVWVPTTYTLCNTLDCITRCNLL